MTPAKDPETLQTGDNPLKIEPSLCLGKMGFWIVAQFLEWGDKGQSSSPATLVFFL